VRRDRVPAVFAAALAAAALVAAVAGCGPDPARVPAAAPGSGGPSVEERVADLLGRMTSPEKVSQMLDNAPGLPHLGVPPYGWWNEALHGVARAGVATVFPQAIGLAADWDTDLLHEVASVISDEARAKHHGFLEEGIRTRYHGLTFWSPNINIFRDPRWGRGQETYGEDPFLTSRMAVAFVRGLQGDDPQHRKVDATLKHFAVHSGPEPLRHRFRADCSDRDLRETYLYAFERAVREARPAAVMCAYNRFRGEACCASELLLGILRDEWGFDGYVVSDCGAIWDIFAGHRLVPGPVEAAALALSRGCDLNCGPTYLGLLPAEPAGLVTEVEVDRAVGRLFRTRFELGMFDPEEAVPHAQIPPEVNDSEPHRRLNREAARKSIVLLKNDGILPLRKEALRRVAVVGPSADNLDVLVGNYHGTPSRPVTLLAGIQAAAGGAFEVVHAAGCGYVGANRFFEPALAAIRGADVAIVCAGLTPELEGEEKTFQPPVDGFDRGDRTRIELPEIQGAFLRAVVRTGVPVVLVLTTGSPVALPEEDRSLPAIVNAWYPGGEGGTAVAEVLFGEANPSGRLPVTFYRSTADLPDFERYDMEGRTYRYFRGDALYAFGHGLSYAEFRYAGLDLSRTEIGPEDRTLRVDVTVENTGGRDGEEVVQVYLRDAESTRPMPLKRLAAFGRIFLPAGGRGTLSLEIASHDFASYDEARGGWAVEPGDFEVQAGASSRDIRLTRIVRVR